MFTHFVINGNFLPPHKIFCEILQNTKWHKIKNMSRDVRFIIDGLRYISSLVSSLMSDIFYKKLRFYYQYWPN